MSAASAVSSDAASGTPPLGREVVAIVDPAHALRHMPGAVLVTSLLIPRARFERSVGGVELLGRRGAFRGNPTGGGDLADDGIGQTMMNHPEDIVSAVDKAAQR